MPILEPQPVHPEGDAVVGRRHHNAPDANDRFRCATAKLVAIVLATTECCASPSRGVAWPKDAIGSPPAPRGGAPGQGPTGCVRETRARRSSFRGLGRASGRGSSRRRLDDPSVFDRLKRVWLAFDRKWTEHRATSRLVPERRHGPGNRADVDSGPARLDAIGRCQGAERDAVHCSQSAHFPLFRLTKDVDGLVTLRSLAVSPGEGSSG